MIEFAANNHVNVSIKVTSFFVNHRFHPRINIEPSDISDSKQKTKFLAVDQIIKKQDKITKFL